MATAKVLRRQATTCSNLANQTHDEESRQRCLRLAQTFLQLADEEEQLAGQAKAPVREGATKLNM